MIERVVDNWLGKSGERAYQVAFCYMLAHRGESVVHLTRHCAMEMGKDVLTVAADGTPCAYQLKGGDISLTTWRKEVGPQVDDLVMGAISHPSLQEDRPHRSYLVTNGRIEEEVHRAIEDRNRQWGRSGFGPLHTITKGEMLAWALDLGSDLWPSELQDVGGLIELATWDGTDVFPKARLASLLESMLGLGDDERPSRAACSRALSSAALVTALASGPFAESENHVAEIEAWVVYASYAVALAERWSLPTRVYQTELDLAKRAAFNALGRLAEEVHERESNERRLVEGDATVDSPFYRARMTWVVGLLSTYALWRRGRPDGFASDEDPFDFDVDRFCLSFAHGHRRDLLMWGEAAIPHLLAYHWAWRVTDGTWDPNWFLASMTRDVARANRSGLGGLPSPYYEIGDLAPHWIDRELSEFMPDDLRLERKPIDETFAGTSSYLDGLFHLVVRKNYKQTAKALWPAVSRVSSVRFEPDAPWQLLRWRNPETGRERQTLHAPTQDWSTLRTFAEQSDDAWVPEAFKADPAFVMLHLLVFPHRGESAKLRWLDTGLRQKCRGR